MNKTISKVITAGALLVAFAVEAQQLPGRLYDEERVNSETPIPKPVQNEVKRVPAPTKKTVSTPIKADTSEDYFKDRDPRTVCNSINSPQDFSQEFGDIVTKTMPPSGVLSDYAKTENNPHGWFTFLEQFYELHGIELSAAKKLKIPFEKKDFNKVSFIPYLSNLGRLYTDETGSELLSAYSPQLSKLIVVKENLESLLQPKDIIIVKEVKYNNTNFYYFYPIFSISKDRKSFTVANLGYNGFHNSWDADRNFYKKKENEKYYAIKKLSIVDFVEQGKKTDFKSLRNEGNDDQTVLMIFRPRVLDALTGSHVCEKEVLEIEGDFCSQDWQKEFIKATDSKLSLCFHHCLELDTARGRRNCTSSYYPPKTGLYGKISSLFETLDVSGDVKEKNKLYYNEDFDYFMPRIIDGKDMAQSCMKFPDSGKSLCVHSITQRLFIQD